MRRPTAPSNTCVADPSQALAAPERSGFPSCARRCQYFRKELVHDRLRTIGSHLSILSGHTDTHWSELVLVSVLWQQELFPLVPGEWNSHRPCHGPPEPILGLGEACRADFRKSGRVFRNVPASIRWVSLFPRHVLPRSRGEISRTERQCAQESRGPLGHLRKPARDG